ncbi:MAG TPA: hypothetical protein VM165_25595 [Planctomycetaceae bacterium]|nr:hypothetical protein [Planctomycetaceae bacterium]
MFGHLRSAFGVGLACAAFSGSVIAQDDAPGKRDGALRPVAAGGKTEVVRLSTVMKSKVIIQEDQAAGQIVDVVLNDGGCIDYVVASYEDEYYAIPYSTVTLRHSDRVVFVDITPAQFRKVTFFGANQWPDFYSTTYQKNVFNVFGVNAVRNDGPREALKPNLDRAQDRREDRRDDAKDRRDDRRDPEGTAGEKGAEKPRDKKDADAPREKLQDRADNLKDKAEPKTDRKSDAPTPRSDDKPNLPDKPKAELPKAEKPKAEAPKADLPKPNAPKPIAPSTPKPKDK